MFITMEDLVILSYKVRDEEFEGHLYSKRQYRIEEGELLDIRDIDLDNE